LRDRGFNPTLPGLLWFAFATGTAPGAPQRMAIPADSSSVVVASISATEVVADAQGGAVGEVSLVSGGEVLTAIQWRIEG